MDWESNFCCQTRELFTYASDLRSMTQARGSFTIAFDRYEELPKEAADKVIAAAKVED